MRTRAVYSHRMPHSKELGKCLFPEGCGLTQWSLTLWIATLGGMLRTQTGSVALQTSALLPSNIQSLAWHSSTVGGFSEELTALTEWLR